MNVDSEVIQWIVIFILLFWNAGNTYLYIGHTAYHIEVEDEERNARAS